MSEHSETDKKKKISTGNNLYKKIMWKEVCKREKKKTDLKYKNIINKL